MSDQFLAEIRIFAFNFAPSGWAMCDGQVLSIAQNTALFSLLGTTFGGNGVSTFQLPNLQGSVAIHTTQFGGTSQFGSYSLGQTGGTSAVTLLTTQIPAHTHTVNGEAYFKNAVASSPAGAVPAAPTPLLVYDDVTSSPPVLSAMSPLMVATTGGNQAHNNLMPYLVLNFCISLVGIYPARN